VPLAAPGTTLGNRHVLSHGEREQLDAGSVNAVKKAAVTAEYFALIRVISRALCQKRRCTAARS